MIKQQKSEGFLSAHKSKGFMTCPKCKYEWKRRDKDKKPRVCPRCKVRLDYGKYNLKKEK